MGGMVGMWLGANAGNRIDKLILSNTSSFFPDRTMWDGRVKLVREKGLEGIVDANMERWFTKGFRDRAPEAMARMKKMFVATKVDGYVGCGEAIRDMDHRPLLSKITAPTLVIAGKHDPATPLEGNEFIKQHIPGARIAVLEAAHIANIEQPQVYADTVLGFLPQLASKPPSSFYPGSSCSAGGLDRQNAAGSIGRHLRIDACATGK